MRYKPPYCCNERMVVFTHAELSAEVKTNGKLSLQGVLVHSHHPTTLYCLECKNAQLAELDKRGRVVIREA